MHQYIFSQSAFKDCQWPYEKSALEPCILHRESCACKARVQNINTGRRLKTSQESDKRLGTILTSISKR